MNKQLIALIYQRCLEAAESGDWSTVVTILNTKDVKKDSTKKGSAEVLMALGEAVTEQTLEVIGQSEIGGIGKQKLANAGLDFSSPWTIGLIERMRPLLPDGAADKLLALGYVESWPAGHEVSLDEVVAAWTESQVEARIQAWDSAIDSAATAYRAGRIEECREFLSQVKLES
jgi:hypothetical protein